jgi:predicted GNAT family acetyltransferase
VEIENNEADSRWEVKLDARVIAFVEYKSRPDRVTLIHTEVDPDFEGQGIGSRLARTVLDDAVARGLRVTLYCPFIRSYVDRHPEYEKYIDAPKSRS